MLSHRVHLGLENMCVGAKHDRSQYEIISNNLSAVMLRPLQKPDAPYPIPTRLRFYNSMTATFFLLFSSRRTTVL
jgi:hypothetical protein